MEFLDERLGKYMGSVGGCGYPVCGGDGAVQSVAGEKQKNTKIDQNRQKRVKSVEILGGGWYNKNNMSLF